MVTKLKNILYSSRLQIIASILAIIFLTSGTYFSIMMSSDNNLSKFDFSILMDTERYGDSAVVESRMQDIYRQCGIILQNSASTDPEDIQDVASAKNYLGAMEKEIGLKWLVESKGKVIASEPELTIPEIKKYPIYFIDNQGAVDATNQWAQYGLGNRTGIDGKIAFGLSDSGQTTVSEAEAQYQKARGTMSIMFQVVFLCYLGGGICFVLGCFNAGHGKDRPGITLYPVDAYWDVNLMITLTLWGMLFSGALATFYLPVYISLICVLGSILVLYAFAMSWVRLAKAHSVISHLLILYILGILWRGVLQIGHAIQEYYFEVVKDSSLVGLYFAMVFGVILLTLFTEWAPVLGIPLSLVVIYVLSKKVRVLSDIRQGVKQMNDGDKTFIIKVEGQGAVEDFGRQINTLRENLLKEIDAAVEKELKSERLKTELITNVSHDIRTPLTSIIAYVDILKSPNIPEEDRQKYICILDEKANRLKNLTDDLFEAAKASTGNIDIQLDAVNPEALMDQALGEFEEKLKAAELQIIMTRPEEKILVQADGRQFWWVIENLLTNVVKYALKGSHVYIDIRRENNEGVLEVKNISAQALGIPAEELMERFKRGDGARHTEGSGLGLAITRDLTELQGGHFEIAIDGDLFKALVWMPVVDQKE